MVRRIPWTLMVAGAAVLIPFAAWYWSDLIPPEMGRSFAAYGSIALLIVTAAYVWEARRSANAAARAAVALRDARANQARETLYRSVIPGLDKTLKQSFPKTLGSRQPLPRPFSQAGSKHLERFKAESLFLGRRERDIVEDILAIFDKRQALEEEQQGSRRPRSMEDQATEEWVAERRKHYQGLGQVVEDARGLLDRLRGEIEKRLAEY